MRGLLLCIVSFVSSTVYVALPFLFVVVYIVFDVRFIYDPCLLTTNL